MARAPSFKSGSGKRDAAGMSVAEKILIRGVNWLGDAVMTTPALQRLREARPKAEITMLTPAKLADLWRSHPCVNDVIAITDEENVWQVGRRLRWGNFDTALIFPNSPRTALEAWLGRIPRRIGYARPWRNLLLTEKISPRTGEIKMHKRSVAEIKQLVAAGAAHSTVYPAAAHHIHQYLHLVSAAFGASPEPIAPLLNATAEDIAAVRKRFQIDDAQLVLGLNAGAEYGPAKRWPKDLS